MGGSGRPRRPAESEADRAYREYTKWLGEAWREDGELSSALHLAFMTGDTTLVKQCLAADKPASANDKRGLVALIQKLEERKRGPGRPRREANKARSAEKAERNAAWRVAGWQKQWLAEHKRERMSDRVTSEMIDEAIAEASREFGVPVAQISRAAIRSALKSGLFVPP